MNNYNCKVCIYKTQDSSNWVRHLKSQRHNRSSQSNTDTLVDHHQLLQIITNQQAQNNHLAEQILQLQQQIPELTKQVLQNSQLHQQIAELTSRVLQIENQYYRLYTTSALKNMCIQKSLDITKCTIKEHYISLLENKPINIVKKKKEKIPATLRNTVWAIYNKDNNEGICKCCKVEKISCANFECGHVMAENNGGDVNLSNLVPICGLCNKSMGTEDMREFMRRYGYGELLIEEFGDY